MFFFLDPVSFVVRFCWLLFGHALMDYSLQTDFMARGKNRNTPMPGVPWYYLMSAHCILHAGMVVFLTGNVWYGLAEFIIHLVLDIAKCEGYSNIHTDQWGHITCKLLWAM